MILVGRGAAKAFRVGRGRLWALAPCDFQVAPGEILGVVGPNGAGKTTLLRLMAGEVPLTSGELLVAGFRAGSRSARRIVGVAPDPPVAPAELTGVEWLEYLATHRSRSQQERRRMVRSAVEMGDLSGVIQRPIGGYSRGTVQRLALAAAVLCGDAVVLLDETLSGIDPLVARTIRTRIVELAAAGRTVVLASHDLSTIERVASRALVLAKGRVVADVRIAALLEERIVELSLASSSLARADELLSRVPGAKRTGRGVVAPLRRGATPDQLLAICRAEGIALNGMRCRYRRLEDVLEAAVSPPA